jgi:hypothetical protein
MNYPVLAIQHGGFTQMLGSEEYWTSLPLAFVKLYKRRIGVLFFYSKDGNKWRLRSIRPGESIGLIPRVFGLWMGLSLRPVSVVVEFEPAAPYATEDLRAVLRSAVEADDDISEAKDVKPVLWTECFKLGDITFLAIENLARRVAGAVFLATPDDDSVIREQRVKTPRANVLFEYGYLPVC